MMKLGFYTHQAQANTLEAGVDDSSVVVNPRFLLRITGIPINMVDELRFQQSLTAINDVLAIEARLVMLKEPLMETLFQAIGKVTQKQFRHLLLNLKRDVFNFRPLSGKKDVQPVLEMLAPDEAVRLVQWQQLWQECRQAKTKAERIFRRELADRRKCLKETIQTSDLRKGLLLASPTLDRAVDSYLASDNFQLGKRHRATERSLVSYLLRAACKTSPFSTFTAVSTGTFEDLPPGNGGVILQLENQEKQSFTQLNIAALSRFTALIIASEEVRHGLPVQLTTGWRSQDVRIRYLRRRHDLRYADDGSDLNLVHEDILYLPEGQLLSDLLRLMGDNRQVRYGQLVAELSNLLGYQHSASQVDQFLQHFLRLGLLVAPGLYIDIHSLEPLADYSRGVAEIGTAATDEIAQRLETVSDLVMTYAHDDVPTRRRSLGLIRNHLHACYGRLNGSAVALPDTLIYEDTTLRGRHLALDKHHWAQTLSALSQFQTLLPIFDVNIERKLVTKGYFRARYGRGQSCDDFVSFAENFNMEFYEQFLERSMSGNRNLFDDQKRFIGSRNHFRQAEIQQLDQARQAIADYITDAYAKRAPDSHALILDQAFVDTITPYIPPTVTDFQSYSYFSQIAEATTDTPLLIINRVYNGLTAMFSRFSGCFPEKNGFDLIPQLRQVLLDTQPSNAIFAELRGGYDTTNLNLHPPFTSHEIVCPGDVIRDNGLSQIPVSDLVIQDDPVTDTLRLYSPRLQKEIIPIYLGFLIPMALPEVQQVLLNFSYPVMAPIYLWLGTNAPSTGDTIAFYPRLQYRNIVIHRALWKLNPAYFPRRTPGESDFAFYRRVIHWQRENDLPSRLFVTPDAAPDRAAEDGDPNRGGAGGTYKPFYVDFENYFSVALLEAAVQDSSRRLVLNEMLPHRNDLYLTHNGGDYVTEFILEMTQVRRT